MLAFAAPRERDHMVAHCQMLDCATDCGNDTRPLVTVNRGIRHLEIAVTGVQIGMANAGRSDLDQHFIGSRRVEIEALKVEGARLLLHYSRGNAHAIIPAVTVSCASSGLRARLRSAARPATVKAAARAA